MLVTSASKKVPLIRSVIKAAQKVDPKIVVFAGDFDSSALTSYLIGYFWHMPRIVDGELETIVNGCRERDIRTIFPTRDGELIFWAQHKSRFVEAGIDVIVSPTKSVQVCLDKLAFAQFGLAHGLPFIPTGRHPHEIGPGPYMVKERFGAGARKIGLNLDMVQALEHGRSMENPIYQPFILGKEISIDAWLDRFHRVKGLVLRSRDHVVKGESQVTTTFRDPLIETKAIQVLQALKLRGPVVMQVLINANKEFHVIECNTRFGGASTTSIAAGLDIFYWNILDSYGVNVCEYTFDRVSGEVRQIRVPHDIHLYDHHF